MINDKKKFNWKTLPELFFEEAKKQLDKPLLWYKINNQYKSYSWKIVRKRILLLSSKLIQLGIKKGDKVIIISENNPNWFITDFAIMLTGGITVPAYTTYTKKDYEYLIKDSQAKMVFISNKKLFLIDASNSHLLKNKNINLLTELDISKSLMTKDIPDPDFVIRTLEDLPKIIENINNNKLLDEYHRIKMYQSR